MTNPHPAYITPDYETISTVEKRQLAELMESSLLNGFNQQDFQDVLSVFNRVWIGCFWLQRKGANSK